MQADLNLGWAHMSVGMFSHIAAQILAPEHATRPF